MSSKQYQGPTKLAVFESTGKYTYRSIFTESEAELSDLARISQWLEVNFDFRTDEEINAEKVAKLDQEIEKTLTSAMKQVAQLRERKQELLAISFETPLPDFSTADFTSPEIFD